MFRRTRNGHARVTRHITSHYILSQCFAFPDSCGFLSFVKVIIIPRNHLLITHIVYIRTYISHTVRKCTFRHCAQRRFKSACAFAPSEDSDQPAHSRSLIRIFTGRILIARMQSFIMLTTTTLIRLRGCADCLSLRWAHVSEWMSSQVMGYSKASQWENIFGAYENSKTPGQPGSSRIR